ncbi:MAG: halocarboxylic acid dehydrogenase DehI family protein [Terriglobales bacterium]
MAWKKGNRLRMVTEQEADAPTRCIYSEIKQGLSTPALHDFYPALAAYPQFLRLHWNLMRPVVTSRQFHGCAERLRADAYTRAHNYLRIPDLTARLPEPDSSLPQLREAIEVFHHKDSLLLLLFSMQIQAMEAPVGKQIHDAGAASKPPAEAPALVAESDAPASVRHTYEEIRRVLELPYVNAEYQAMARFPEYLNGYWELLKSLLQSPLYQEGLFAIQESAWELARELPGPLELSVDQLIAEGMQEQEIASIARILELFVKNLSGLVMNIAIAKISIEGGNQMTAGERVSPSDSERVA